MRRPTADRRQFLSTVAGGAAASFLPSFAPLGHVATASDFLLADGLTYLNTGTIGPCRRSTLDTIQRSYATLEANPVAHYGRFAGEPLIEDTRTVASKFLGCVLSEIMITSSTTSGMNAIAQGMGLKAGDRVIVTDQEHSGGLHCWQYLAKHAGVELDVVHVPQSEHRSAALVDRIAAIIRDRTRVISVSHVFSSTGLRMPVAEIAAVARSRGVLCVVDGAQSAGAIRVNVRELGCHAYATSGHKWLLGPKGTGLLYIAKDAADAIRPLAFDGSHNTYNDGSGVVDLPAILGLGTAIRYLESAGIEKIEAHNLGLRNRFAEHMRTVNGLTVVSPPAGELAAPMLTALLDARFDRTIVVQALLEKHRVAIRPTHPEFGFNGIRFSMHEFNTEGDVDRAADALQRVLA